jgi:hypothetical protein
MNVAARAGRAAEAYAAAASIPDNLAADRSAALRELAAAQAGQQQFEAAWQTAQGCIPADKLTAYAAIMRAYADLDQGKLDRVARGRR